LIYWSAEALKDAQQPQQHQSPEVRTSPYGIALFSEKTIIHFIILVGFFLALIFQFVRELRKIEDAIQDH